MKLKSCRNVLVGKSLLGQYVRSTHVGNSLQCMLFPAQALSGILPQAKTEAGTTLIRSSGAQAHHKPFYLALKTLPSSPCASWSQFSLLHPPFSDFFPIHCLLKTILSKCLSQKWYIRSTSTYFSFPRTEIFSNETSDTYTPLGFIIILVMKD